MHLERAVSFECDTGTVLLTVCMVFVGKEVSRAERMWQKLAEVGRNWKELAEMVACPSDRAGS